MQHNSRVILERSVHNITLFCLINQISCDERKIQSALRLECLVTPRKRQSLGIYMASNRGQNVHLVVSTCRLVVTTCRLVVPTRRLVVSNCRLVVSSFQLVVSTCLLVVLSCQLVVSSCRLFNLSSRRVVFSTCRLIEAIFKIFLEKY